MNGMRFLLALRRGVETGPRHHKEIEEKTMNDMRHTERYLTPASPPALWGCADRTKAPTNHFYNHIKSMTFTYWRREGRKTI